MSTVIRFATILFSLSAFLRGHAAVALGSAHATSRSKYTRAHRLGDSYSFDPREGWQSVNITNLPYKYQRAEVRPPSNTSDGSFWHSMTQRSLKNHKHPQQHESHFSTFGAAVLGKVMASLKGIGKPQSATLTWYTGHDLQNPSCWAKNVWAPTDSSFACALTLQGWTTRPKCFQFLELCNDGNKKCVFVRVVDSCAGCAPGSKHIDLTKAAFEQLASLDTGIITGQFRIATEPDPTHWLLNLWGPRV